MTVKELIDLLTEEDPNKEVRYRIVESYDDDPAVYNENITGIHRTTDHHVILEGN
jgi:hypothetical protein